MTGWKLVPLTATKGVGDYLAHPLAELMPMISDGDDFANLKADLAKNGLRDRIVLFDDGSGLKILDGRNRHRGLKDNGHTFAAADFEVFVGTVQEAEDFVFSKNFHRRQLTNGQKQEIIRAQLDKYPDWSSRKIARYLGIASHTTVEAVRQKMLNPPDKRKYDEFKRAFNDLSDEWRAAFAREFANDLRELLGT